MRPAAESYALAGAYAPAACNGALQSAIQPRLAGSWGGLRWFSAERSTDAAMHFRTRDPTVTAAGHCQYRVTQFLALRAARAPRGGIRRTFRVDGLLECGRGGRTRLRDGKGVDG